MTKSVRDFTCTATHQYRYGISYTGISISINISVYCIYGGINISFESVSVINIVSVLESILSVSKSLFSVSRHTAASFYERITIHQ